MIRKREPFSIIILDDDEEKDMKSYKDRLEEEMPEASIAHLLHVGDFLNKAHDHSPDLILLDIIGMDYHPYDAITEIQKRWIGLPIILFTNIYNQRDAVDLLREGAFDYFIKVDFGSIRMSAFSHSADRKVTAWRRLVDRIREAVDRYKPIKRALSDNHVIGDFTKERGDSDLSAFKEQVEFLRLVEKFQDVRVRDLFPPLLASSDDRYVIPRYRAAPMRKILFDTVYQDDIERAAQRILEPVLKTLKERLFNEKSEPLTEEKHRWFIDSFYLKKLDDRRIETLALIAKAEGVNFYQRQALTDLLMADRFLLNGKPMDSPLTILGDLLADKKKRKRWLPKTVGWIHGDLHFGNILGDLTVPEMPFVKLIDPRGYRSPGADFAFDVGKLLHSCHGQYDMIDEGYLNTEDAMRRLDKDQDGTLVVTLPTLKEYVKKKEKGRSEATGESRIKIVTEQHLNAYEGIHKWLVSLLDRELFSDDPEWKGRAYLSEALHFCRMGPGKEYLKEDASKLFAFYITGVRLMNELREVFS